MTVPLTDRLHDVYRNRRSTSKYPFILPGRHVVILTEYFIKITAVAIAQHERNLFNRKRRTFQKNACPLHAQFQEEPEQSGICRQDGQKGAKKCLLTHEDPDNDKVFFIPLTERIPGISPSRTVIWLS